MVNKNLYLEALYKKVSEDMKEKFKTEIDGDVDLSENSLLCNFFDATAKSIVNETIRNMFANMSLSPIDFGK